MMTASAREIVLEQMYSRQNVSDSTADVMDQGKILCDERRKLNCV